MLYECTTNKSLSHTTAQASSAIYFIIVLVSVHVVDRRARSQL